MDTRIIFGLSGSISAYKAIDVIRNLRKLGFGISPLFSESAHRFVTPWTIETLAESPLVNDDVKNGTICHLDICESAQAFVICPASANCIAKLATGLADDLLSASFLSFSGPKILFPAMHTEMYENPITQKNIALLRDSGVIVIEPTHGELACGDTGNGRLPDQSLITDIIQFSLLPSIDLSDKHIVITCGGTTEPIDPVRSITNSATGISGHAMANMAAFFGANVTLIRSNQHPVLNSIKSIDISTASELEHALLPFASSCDMLIMNAAVSDFSIIPKPTKQSRQSFSSLDVCPTTDILAAFNEKKLPHCKSIGFCLSDAEDLITIAKQKRIEKSCDVIVANGVDSFGSDFRTIHIISDKDISSIKHASVIDTAAAILSC